MAALPTNCTSKDIQDRSDCPDEIWKLIISKVTCIGKCKCKYHDSHLEPLSLVSKRFLVITNELKTTIRASDISTADYHKGLFWRFPNIVQISLYGYSLDADKFIHELAQFNFQLRVLDLSRLTDFPRESISRLPKAMCTTIRSLILRGFNRLLKDDDVGIIANLFPNLEEVNLSDPLLSSKRSLTDDGIVLLASKIRGLRKINLENNWWLTDKSVIALCENCPDLEEIKLAGCYYVTPDAVADLGF